MSRNNHLVTFIGAGAVTVSLTCSVRSQCTYDVTVIQAPDVCGILGPVITIGTGLNENGEVVGYWYCPASENRKAFVWTPESGLVTLKIPTGFSGAEAWDISGLGHIVGRIRLAAIDRYRAVLWQDGQAFNLGTLPGGNFSEAFAINSRGQIVGCWGNNNTGPIHGFIWEDGVMTDLGPSLGTASSSARAISDAGQVVGWMGSGFLVDGEAFIWEKGVATGLGPIPGGFFSIAEAINHSGNVVGWGLVLTDGFPIRQTRGFLWQDGTMIDLVPLPGFLRSGSVDVNDNRQVVGRSWSSLDNPSASAAFIWQNRVMTNLNDLIPPELGVHLTFANAINNQGQITGQASTASGVLAVLLTPVEGPPGDLDGDCRVRVPDLLSLLAAWGPCSPKLDCPADLNNDGTVNQLDLVLLIVNWG